jgi:hypothetical protein
MQKDQKDESKRLFNLRIGADIEAFRLSLQRGIRPACGIRGESDRRYAA